MPSHSQIRFAPLLWVALFQTVPIAAIVGQDPVNRPIAASASRLPAPKNVTATQENDGRIRVVWTEVPGATGYSLVRSVPPDRQQPVVPNPTDPVFFDSDVRLGSTYYYVVAAINEGGTIGLRAGSPPVKATRSARPAGVNTGESSALAAPTDVVATVNPGGGAATVNWRYGGRWGLTFLVERTIDTDKSSGWQPVTETRTPTSPAQPGVGLGTTLAGLREGTRVTWRVTAIDAATRARSAPTESNELIVPATPVSGGSSAGSAVGTAAGTVTVSMGASHSVSSGSTVSLASALAGSSASRWVSLDEGLATVDASGTATGRAPGRAQILALGRSPDGSARVTLVILTVTP